MVRVAVRSTAIACALAVVGLIGMPVAANAATPTPVVACPDQIVPPPAVDASEQPVPEPTVPTGGQRMAECGDIVPAGAPPLPADLAYSSWVLQDLDSGVVLAA